MGKPAINSETWKKVLGSPILEHSFSLLKQIFKREFGFSDNEGIGIPKDEFRQISRNITNHKASFPFCDTIFATKTGSERCYKELGDAYKIISTTHQPYIKTCHAGLTEICVPIIINGTYYGCQTINGGLLLNSPNEAEWLKITERVRDAGVDLNKLKQAYFQIAPVSQELLEVMLRLLNIIIEEIAKTVLATESDKRRINELENALFKKYNFERIIGKSSAIQDIFRLLAKIIETDSSVLIEGETGTGKELIANTIHYNSSRKNYPFTPVNCGSLAEPLLESELFGHIKGSFTGAIRDKKGLFEVTDKGTIFLDEIAEMSPALQVKLLRVLQEGTFMPVGGTETRKIDVRVISATNKNLQEMVAQNKFREDLYYRLNVIKILLPPLRERKEDISLLINHFTETNETSRKKKIIGIKPDALKCLLDYHWPGNVRELQNILERAIALTGSNYITSKELPEEIIRKEKLQRSPDFTNISLEEARGFVEKQYLLQLLTKTHGNMSRAAKCAKISRDAIYKLLKKHRIEPNKFREQHPFNAMN